MATGSPLPWSNSGSTTELPFTHRTEGKSRQNGNHEVERVHWKTLGSISISNEMGIPMRYPTRLDLRAFYLGVSGHNEEAAREASSSSSGGTSNVWALSEVYSKSGP